MNDYKLYALTGRQIKPNQKYTLIRLNRADELIMNVLEIVSPLVFDPAQGSKVFTAKALYLGRKELTLPEGSPIELNLDDIGCPWRGSPAGTTCRTFRYVAHEYQSLLQDVEHYGEEWRLRFSWDEVVIRFQVKAQSDNQFTLPATKAANKNKTALSHWTYVEQ